MLMQDERLTPDWIVTPAVGLGTIGRTLHIRRLPALSVGD